MKNDMFGLIGMHDMLGERPFYRRCLEKRRGGFSGVPYTERVEYTCKAIMNAIHEIEQKELLEKCKKRFNTCNEDFINWATTCFTGIFFRANLWDVFDMLLNDMTEDTVMAFVNEHRIEWIHKYNNIRKEWNYSHEDAMLYMGSQEILKTYNSYPIIPMKRKYHVIWGCVGLYAGWLILFSFLSIFVAVGFIVPLAIGIFALIITLRDITVSHKRSENKSDYNNFNIEPKEL